MSFIAKGTNPEPSVAYSLHDSSVTFSLEQLIFPWLSLALTLLVVIGSYYFVEYPSIGVSLKFSHY